MLRNDEEASLLETAMLVGMVDDFYKGCFRDDFYVSLLSAKWLNAKSPEIKTKEETKLRLAKKHVNNSGSNFKVLT